MTVNSQSPAEGPLVTPWGPVVPQDPPSEMAERILDAAAERFVQQGVAATTISQIAADAGISRMWLYRHYANRDAIVCALFGREAVRFIRGLLEHDDPGRDPLDLALDVFVYAVGFLRGHPLLQRMITTDAEVVALFLTSQIGTTLRFGTQALTPYISTRFGLSTADARPAAETIMRLVTSITVSGGGGVDFDDERQLRAFADAIIPRLLRR